MVIWESAFSKPYKKFALTYLKLFRLTACPEIIMELLFTLESLHLCDKKQ